MEARHDGAASNLFEQHSTKFGWTNRFVIRYRTNRRNDFVCRSVFEHVSQRAVPHTAEENVPIGRHANHDDLHRGKIFMNLSDEPRARQAQRHGIEHQYLRLSDSNRIEHSLLQGRRTNNMDANSLAQQASESFPQQSVLREKEDIKGAGFTHGSNPNLAGVLDEAGAWFPLSRIRDSTAASSPTPDIAASTALYPKREKPNPAAAMATALAAEITRKFIADAPLLSSGAT